MFLLMCFILLQVWQTWQLQKWSWFIRLQTVDASWHAYWQKLAGIKSQKCKQITTIHKLTESVLMYWIKIHITD